MGRLKVQTYRIHEGSAEWLVRGTDDPKEALDILLKDQDAFDEMYWLVENKDQDVEPKLRVERTGYFRMNPCRTGEFGWLLGRAAGPGRGNFKGVYCDPAWDVIEYDSDIMVE